MPRGTGYKLMRTFLFSTLSLLWNTGVMGGSSGSCPFSHCTQRWLQNIHSLQSCIFWLSTFGLHNV